MASNLLLGTNLWSTGLIMQLEYFWHRCCLELSWSTPFLYVCPISLISYLSHNVSAISFQYSIYQIGFQAPDSRRSPRKAASFMRRCWIHLSTLLRRTWYDPKLTPRLMFIWSERFRILGYIPHLWSRKISKNSSRLAGTRSKRILSRLRLWHRSLVRSIFHIWKRCRCSYLAIVGGVDSVCARSSVKLTHWRLAQTLAVLTTFFHTLILHPEAQKRAQTEIDAVVGTTRLPNFDDRKSLPYVEALFREVDFLDSTSKPNLISFPRLCATDQWHQSVRNCPGYISIYLDIFHSCGPFYDGRGLLQRLLYSQRQVTTLPIFTGSHT